jgi:hypothetical protein
MSGALGVLALEDDFTGLRAWVETELARAVVLTTRYEADPQTVASAPGFSDFIRNTRRRRNAVRNALRNRAEHGHVRVTPELIVLVDMKGN